MLDLAGVCATRFEKARLEAARPASAWARRGVYKGSELVGASSESWEKAAAVAIERAAMSLRDLRIAEVVEQDLVIEDGKVESYRTKLKVSFKYESND